MKKMMVELMENNRIVEEVVVVCWLLNVPATCYVVYLRDGSA